jgi:hypothetical protein
MTALTRHNILQLFSFVRQSLQVGGLEPRISAGHGSALASSLTQTFERRWFLFHQALHGYCQ